jgi:hypothetical protein
MSVTRIDADRPVGVKKRSTKYTKRREHLPYSAPPSQDSGLPFPEARVPGTNRQCDVTRIAAAAEIFHNATLREEILPSTFPHG